MIRQNGRDFLHRLNDPALVVHMHHGDEQSVVAEGLGDRLRVHPAGRIARQADDLEAPFFENFQGLQHRLVLDLRGDNVPSPRAAPLVFQTEDRQVVGLGGTRREQHLIRLRLHDRGDLRPGVLHGPLRPNPIVMRPGSGVPELGVQKLDDEIPHPGLDRGGGVAIEVRGHGSRLPILVGGLRPSLCVCTELDKQCYNRNKLRSTGGSHARQHHDYPALG